MYNTFNASQGAKVKLVHLDESTSKCIRLIVAEKTIFSTIPNTSLEFEEVNKIVKRNATLQVYVGDDVIMYGRWGNTLRFFSSLLCKSSQQSM